MTTRRGKLSLLDIPTELRVEIYKLLFSTPGTAYGILETCRQIRSEALPASYQRRLDFGCQRLLYRWLDRADSQLLHLVKSVRFTIYSPDLASILRLDRIVEPERSAIWKVHTTELEKLASAFKSFPNLRELTIYEHSNGCSHFLQNLILAFLDFLALECPQLCELALPWNFQPVCLPRPFPNLRSLRVPGLACSPSSINFDSVSQLQDLTDLTIYRPTRTTGLPFCAPWFGPGSLQRMPLLRSLNIYDTSLDPDEDQLFCSAELFESLRSSFSSTLQTLGISWCYPLDETAEKALHAFLKTSAVANLQLRWLVGHGLGSGLLDALPGSLRHLSLNANDQLACVSFIEGVLAERRRFPHLHQVQISTDNQESTFDEPVVPVQTTHPFSF